MRPAYRDLACALGLSVLSLIGPRLEPSFFEAWTFLPLMFAAPLVVSGILLLLPWRPAMVLALIIHLLLLITCGLVVVLSVFLLVTILMAGTALVIGPPAALVALNSAFTLRYLRRVGFRKRQ